MLVGDSVGVRLLLAYALMAIVLAGCEGSSPQDDCQPGAVEGCFCEDGVQGTRVCSTDGIPGVCACAPTGDATEPIVDPDAVTPEQPGDVARDPIEEAPDADVDAHDVPLSDSDATPDVHGEDADDPDDDTTTEGDTAEGDVADVDLSCPESQSRCGARCVDTDRDPDHCGVCHRACPAPVGAMATCTQGTCDAPCGGGDMRLCGGACTSIATDYANCGACGVVCPDDGFCVGGACACLDGSLDRCGTACVDSRTDADNCGACGSRCPAGVPCVDGACACPVGHFCDGACVDTRREAAHCGGCGEACAAGLDCFSGVCGCVDCPEPLEGRELELLDYDAFRVTRGCVNVFVRARMPSTRAWWTLGSRSNGGAWAPSPAAPEAGPVLIETGSGPAAPCGPGGQQIESGGLDWIELVLDGRAWRYTLPVAGPHVPIAYPALYPARDGRLYLDEARTQPAGAP